MIDEAASKQVTKKVYLWKKQCIKLSCCNVVHYSLEVHCYNVHLQWAQADCWPQQSYLSSVHVCIQAYSSRRFLLSPCLNLSCKYSLHVAKGCLAKKCLATALSMSLVARIGIEVVCVCVCVFVTAKQNVFAKTHLIVYNVYEKE